MEQIKQMWKEFLKYSFPSNAHGNDFDLELLDSSIAGCISSFVESGFLENEKIKILVSDIQKLDQNFKKIPIDAQEYFKRISDIGKLVLKERANYIR